MGLKQLPGWVHDDEAVSREDVERFAKMTMAQRIELCLQLCDVTDSIVNARPDRERVRAAEALPAESQALLLRLQREMRGR